MAEYLLVFRDSPEAPQLSPEQMQQHMQKWFTWLSGLKASGTFKAGAPLEPAGKTVRGKSKKVMDGPFAEAKDVVNGYLLVNAKSFDDATEIGRGCPILDVEGSVEVRQVREMNM
jgi:hypothetical protein